MFSAAVSVFADEVAVRLEGELDIATLPCLEGVVEGLLDAGASVVVFDCERITFVDWTSLRRVAALTRNASAAGVDLVLCNLRPFTLEVLERTGLEGMKLRPV